MPAKYENMAFKTCWQMFVIPYRIEIYIQSTKIGRRELFELGAPFFNQLQKKTEFLTLFFFVRSWSIKCEHLWRYFQLVGIQTRRWILEFAARTKKKLFQSHS